LTRQTLLELLESVATGGATPEAALDRISWLPIEAVASNMQDSPAFARLDHHRELRQGYPEVVFAPGKTADQLGEICARLGARNGSFLVTRADAAARERLARDFPAAQVNELGRTVYLEPASCVTVPVHGPVVIATAGTGDIPVAEEAAVTARAFGNPVELVYDIGVAGIHRVLQESKPLRRAAVLIVVAGMEGALASVVGGLVSVPVIAVPTSIGYGASFGGLAALLAMLNSCAAGVTVDNIDNGFGAAAAATRINLLRAQPS
jgi:NCAIR mutase (PurE)-related protein